MYRETEFEFFEILRKESGGFFTRKISKILNEIITICIIKYKLYIQKLNMKEIKLIQITRSHSSLICELFL